MKKIILILAFLLLEMSWACINEADRFAEGITLNADEQVSFDVISSLATEGVHYLKEGEGIEERITYISHYASIAMVNLGYNSIVPGEQFPQIAIVLDSTQDAALFDFSQAIKIELIWLKNQGVITLSDATIEKAAIALTGYPRGNAQYWTDQNIVGNFSSYPEYNSATNMWELYGPSNSGCGLAVAYQLPPQAFKSPTAAKNLNLIPGRGLSITNSTAGFTITLPKEVMETGRIRISNYRGDTVRELAGIDGAQSISWDGTDHLGNPLSTGMYCISFNNTDGRSQAKSFRIK